MIHSGGASVAWRAFHRFGHREEFPAIGWAREMKVHYYDFLSSALGQQGRRGDGYEADLPHFRAFRVGLATQHGYYPAIGDFIHPDRKTWQAMRGDKQGAAEIDFYRKLRALVRSFGPDKAFFTSDCSMSPFVLWGDGECGDHAYPGLLGHPLYTQEPVRHLAALGDKPWRPCAWDFQKMWQPQMKLARQVGAGVGVSNGWIQYTGLARLPEALCRQMIADIESLA